MLNLSMAMTELGLVLWTTWPPQVEFVASCRRAWSGPAVEAWEALASLPVSAVWPFL